MRVGTAVYYLHGDHLGSTSLTTNASGGLVSQARFTPFGEVAWDGGTVAPTDFGFTGQRNESGFGLMDYNARFYSAYLNRFIQPDSIVPDQYNPMDWDRYTYSANNPIRYIDPSGHDYYDPGCDCMVHTGEDDKHFSVFYPKDPCTIGCYPGPVDFTETLEDYRLQKVQDFVVEQFYLVNDGAFTDLQALENILNFALDIAKGDVEYALFLAASVFHRDVMDRLGVENYSYEPITGAEFGITGFDDRYYSSGNTNQLEHFINEAYLTSYVWGNETVANIGIDLWDRGNAPANVTDRELGHVASWWVSNSMSNPAQTRYYLDIAIYFIAIGRSTP